MVKFDEFQESGENNGEKIKLSITLNYKVHKIYSNCVDVNSKKM